MTTIYISPLSVLSLAAGPTHVLEYACHFTYQPSVISVSLIIGHSSSLTVFDVLFTGGGASTAVVTIRTLSHVTAESYSYWPPPLVRRRTLVTSGCLFSRCFGERSGSSRIAPLQPVPGRRKRNSPTAPLFYRFYTNPFSLPRSFPLPWSLDRCAPDYSTLSFVVLLCTCCTGHKPRGSDLRSIDA